MPRAKGWSKMQEKPINEGNTVNTRSFKDMIKILFGCHGNILKNPEKACKFNDFTAKQGAYHTTTTPFLKEP